MLMFLRSRVWNGLLLGALLLSLFGALVAPSPARADTDPPEHDDDRHTPLGVEVTMAELPSVGKSSEVTIVVSSTQPASGVRVEVVASDGLRIEGERAFAIDLRAGEAHTLRTSVTPELAGNHSVSANVSLDFGDGNVWGDSDGVYFNSGDDAATTGFSYEGHPMAGAASPGPGNTREFTSEAFPDGSMPAPLMDEDAEIPADTGEPGGQDDAPRDGDVAAASGYVTIRGNVGMFQRNGNWKNQILLVTRVTANGAVVDWTYSDIHGNFAFEVYEPNMIRIRVWANYRHNSMDIGAIRVVGNGLQTQNPWTFAGWHYNLPTFTGPFPNNELDVGSWGPAYNWEGRRAWWIHQDLMDAWLYTRNHVPPGEPLGSRQPDGVTVEWEPGSDDGNYYFSFDRRVHLEDIGANSSNLVLHEYGHAIMHNVYGFMPANDCPSPHNIELLSTSRCAWSEGWASFFSIFVKHQPVYTHPCALPCSMPASVNFEERSTSGYPYAWDTGEKVEGNVTASLWDFIDPYPDGLDKTDSAITPFWKIWDVFYNNDYTTFADFWIHWVNHVEFTNSTATLYQNTIDFGWTALCQDWQSEPADDRPSLLLPVSNPADPPYQGAFCTDRDVDYFRFDGIAGSTYVIETSELGTANDGSVADTTLTLYRMTQFGGLVQLAFDNNSGGQHLASRITYTPANSGWYFVAVRHADDGGDHNYRYSIDFSEAGGNVAPTVTPPTNRLAAGQMLANPSDGVYTVDFIANWTADDPDGGIASQTLELQVDDAGFQPLTTSMDGSARTYDVPVTLGTTNQLRVSATDTAGNSSDYATGESFEVVGAQETDFTYTGTWKSLNSTNAWGGTYQRTDGVAGVNAVYTFTGAGAALVGLQRPDGGQADIYIDGVPHGTVDFYEVANLNRRVLYVVDGLSAGEHTFEIHWIDQHHESSTGYRLYLDGLIALD